MPGRQVLLALAVRKGTTASEAVDLADLGSHLPELDLARAELAIWGERVGRDRVLEKGDRVEILRPLAIDPRDARRQLAKAGQVMGATIKRND